MDKPRYVSGQELIEGGVCTAIELCEWCASGKLKAWNGIGIPILNLEVKDGEWPDINKLETFRHTPADDKFVELPRLFPNKKRERLAFLFPFDLRMAAFLCYDGPEHTERLKRFYFLFEKVERLASGSEAEIMPESQPLLPDQSGRVAELEATLADRDSQIATLKARMEALEAANGELEARAAAADPKMAKELEELRKINASLRTSKANAKTYKAQIDRWKLFLDAGLKVAMKCLQEDARKYNRSELAEMFKAVGFAFNQGNDGYNDTLLEIFWKALPEKYRNTTGGATRQS